MTNKEKKRLKINGKERQSAGQQHSYRGAAGVLDLELREGFEAGEVNEQEI